MALWRRRGDRPKKPGFTRFLPEARRLMPIWDELAVLADGEERRMEVVLKKEGAYVLIGNPENGVEVARICPTNGSSRLPLCDVGRGELSAGYDRTISAVRHVLHMESRPMLMTTSAKLGAVIEKVCCAA